jgi:hypothetical protein
MPSDASRRGSLRSGLALSILADAPLGLKIISEKRERAVDTTHICA